MLNTGGNWNIGGLWSEHVRLGVQIKGGKLGVGWGPAEVGESLAVGRCIFSSEGPGQVITTLLDIPGLRVEEH